MPIDILSRLAERPARLQRYEQFVSEAVTAASQHEERFIVAAKECRAVALTLPAEADIEKSLMAAAAQEAQVREALDGGYVKFLEAIARSRHRGKAAAATAALARGRNRGMPLNSRRILEVANGLEWGTSAPVFCTDADAGALGPGAAVATHAGETMVSGSLTGPGGETAGQSVATPAEAPGKLPKPALGPGEGPVSGKKKKKKPRVQVALNTLRTEGVDGFSSYIGAAIHEPELLRTVVERIDRARDLGAAGNAALAVVQEKLTSIEPQPCANPERGNTSRQDLAPEFAPLAVERALTAREQLLFHACSIGDVTRVKRLLRHGQADINVGAPETLLCIAVNFNLVGVVSALLSEADIDVNLGHSPTGSNPLFIAVGRGHVEVAKLLLAAPDIDVNLATGQGGTPLQMAVQMGHMNLVELLVAAKGMQINRQRENGATALGMAAEGGQKDIVELLLKKGADPSAASLAGLTPLHVACLRGYAAVVEMLLRAGADMNATVADSNGEELQRVTPYDVARLGCHSQIMRLLERHRAAPATLSVQTSREEPRSPDDKPEPVPPPTVRPHHRLPLEHKKQPEPALRPAATPTPQSSKETAAAPVAATGEDGGETIPADRPGHCPPPMQASGSPGKAAPPVPPTPLAQAKDELRQQVLGKLADDNLESLDGIRLLAGVNDATDLNSLCDLYNRLAHFERVKERARRAGRRAGLSTSRDSAASAPAAAPEFSLDGRTGLNAGAVEVEIARHLQQKYHRFVSQAVNDMEFGRGKRTANYPGLWHASAGIPGVGSCSVFYFADEEMRQFRIVAVGHHVSKAEYRLDYATGKLRNHPRTLVVS